MPVMPDHGASAPLLPSSASHHHPSAAPSPQHPPSDPGPDASRAAAVRRHVARLRKTGRRLLDSRKKHFAVMAVVALDAAALLANVFIRLIACEMRQDHEPWVQAVTSALETAALIISCLFMLELAACVFAYGFRTYFSDWFHVFDAAVIVLSFVIDVGFRGLAESIGSLVVVLRLWRLAKISEEVVVGATERMELLEHHLDELEIENKHLRSQLGLDSVDHSGHE
ncbi:ion transport protein [Hirsutella rhossiliensis]|uniref:Voltage-gated hydrogen channel 1 n=1 Tax=Hirsutella rhossiliensis TaxID=111463 RepID=A0A9P8SNY2_9HYPO|nr:ion transport protein [Hirsutella rhossiliensis]KAH0967611.1 ion transport protein [Hirsutella rhossiliensis]